MKFTSILLLTKATGVNSLSQGEYTKQEEERTEERTRGKANKSQDRMVSRKLRQDKVSAWRGVNSLECYKRLKRISAERKSSDKLISRSLVIFAQAVSVVQGRKKAGCWGGRRTEK